MKKVSLIISAIVITAMTLSFSGGGASNEVTIGTQIWMTENLNVNKFRNGDPIPEAKTNEEWDKAGTDHQPAWCYYNNDSTNGTKYGKLYNWYAVNDPRGLAPEGWIISSDRAWNRLADFLGGESIAGAKMKSKNGWYDNGNGTNKSGFSGLPGGCRYDDGTFNGVGGFGYWWSATGGSILSGLYYLSYKDGVLHGLNYSNRGGFSVRCLRY